MKTLTRLSAAVLIALTLTTTAATILASPAHAEWYENEDEWVEVGTTGRTWTNEQGQLCVEKEYQLHTMTYFIHPDGSRELVNDLPHSRYMVAFECFDQQPQGQWTTWDQYWETGGYWYQGNSGYYDYCRCWAEYWGVEIAVQTHYYLDGVYQYSGGVYTYWETREYWYYD